jgi:hypothetical protein
LIQEQLKQADLMEALLVEQSSSLTSITLSGQASLTLDNPRSSSNRDSKMTVLVLTQQQQRGGGGGGEEFPTIPSLNRKRSSSSSSSSSLLLPLASSSQLKLVSFAQAQKPLSKSVLLGLNPLLVNRDNALFDNLPWAAWSIDPQRHNRDAANNPILDKFHLGKRDAYNRFMGKDWQGRSLAIGNLALRLKYLLDGGDDDDGDGKEALSSASSSSNIPPNQPNDEDESKTALAVRILQLQIRELEMDLAGVEQELAIAIRNDFGEERIGLEREQASLEQKLSETRSNLEKLEQQQENNPDDTRSSSLPWMVDKILNDIANWTTDFGKNAAPYRGAMGYAPRLDSKSDIADSLLPYTSPFDLLKEILQDQLQARVIGCALENTSLLQGNLAMGGAVILQRIAATKSATFLGETVTIQEPEETFGNQGIQGGETMVVECDGDEAIGLALACGVPLKVETSLFNRASVLAAPLVKEENSRGVSAMDGSDSATNNDSSNNNNISANIWDTLPFWTLVEGDMSLQVEGTNQTSTTKPSPISIPRTTASLYDSMVGADSDTKPTNSPMFPVDNPIQSLEDLDALSNAGKAKTLLEMSNFQGRLPRPRVVRVMGKDNNPLDKLLLPLIDESVRSQYLIREAVQKGDMEQVAELKAARSKRQRAKEQAQLAREMGATDKADKWESEAEFLESLRADITQDEGAYSRFLDRDEWYERDRQATAKRVKKSSFGNLLDGVE